jgi:SAM-dependent methyltransferase
MPLRSGELLRALLEVPPAERDAWVDRLLGLPHELPDDVELPLGSVPYLPCPVDAILAAVREAPVGASDVFVDLGSGLGRPALLAHLLTAAPARGVELQPLLVEASRRLAARLELSGVRFVAADAASADFADGTVFFIYSSFNGSTLARVLARLRQVAAHHRIVLCAVDFEPREPWLTERRSSHPALVFYESAPR